MKSILIIILILIILPVLIALFRTWKTQNSPNQKLFLAGRIPNPLPNGPYKGSVENIKTGWQGKKFDATASTGINLISGKQAYPFKTYVGKGIQDKNLEVLKIDYNFSSSEISSSAYNIPQNPLWLKFILDEIVEVSPNHFLGKVHINFFGLIFSLGYFKLEK